MAPCSLNCEFIFSILCEAVTDAITLAKGHLELSEVINKIAPGHSLMVEGGASIISSFLTSGLVDLIVITIAPKFVGDGIGVFQGGVSSFPSIRFYLLTFRS